MCGIAGGFWSQLPNNLEDRINNAISKMKSRGPDDSGVKLFNEKFSCIALAHTRLSIIDLSPLAHQPMFSSDKNFSIIFNGEIYNYLELKNELKSLGYKFNTNSDTEVLLISWIHWGKESLKKFIGMFAFAVYDKNKQTITCARDAFGIKPLYYSNEVGKFLFGSEIGAIKAMADSPLNLNWQRSYDYLVHGDYDSQEDTFFSNVKSLMSGCFIEYDIDTSSLNSPKKWWSPNLIEDKSITYSDAKDTLKHLFLKSIALHLRSDVPLGAALSGGVDSSSVVCAIKHLEPDFPISTFSYVADGALSEERWVDVINKHVVANSHKVYLNQAELVRDLDDMIIAQGEPFGGTSIYAQYRVFKLAKESGVTVTVDGQGADELLAGYNGYPGKRVRSLIDRGNIIGAVDFLFEWSRWPGRSFSRGLKQAISEYSSGGVYNFLRAINGDSRNARWLRADVLREDGVDLSYPELNKYSIAGRRVISELAFSLTKRGLPALLRHADRNSMRFSVESRVPFLTTEIAEFLLTLPEDYLISPHGETKFIFREAMRGIVPDQVLNRRDKVGFETPEADFLLMIAPKVREWLSKDIELPFLDQKKIIQEFNWIVEGKRNFSHQVWRWVNFIRWHQLTFD